MTTTWLVTGGCGFIGTRLIQHLRGTGDVALRVLDNLSVGSEADLARVAPVTRVAGTPPAPTPGGPVQLLEGDVRDAEAAARAAAGVDVVVHLAANTGVLPSVEDPVADCQANVLGTLHVLEGARHGGARKVIFASSGAPLGAQDPPIHEEKLPRPISPYGASKLAGEAYCNVYAATFGLPTVALRFGNVYGPGSLHKGSVVALFIRQALAGETLTVYGDGTQTRDFIHVDDLVAAIEKAAAYAGDERLFQIATGSETTVGEIVDALRAALADHGRELSVRYSEPRAGEVIRNYSDVSRAARELGWRARYPSVAQGVRDTLEWFLAQGEGARS